MESYVFSPQAASAVLGPNDSNLSYLEALLRTDLSVRGTSISSSSQSPVFIPLMKRLEKIAERNGTLAEPEIFMEYQLLSEPETVVEGSVKELAEKYGTDIQTMTGFLDGINESLKGYENPIETMDENTEVKIEIDPEKLYYNMVDAKANWLYELPQWKDILSEEKRAELYKKCKASGTVRRQGKKIYPNDPCPCGSGKKYKKCCGKNA